MESVSDHEFSCVAQKTDKLLAERKAVLENEEKTKLAKKKRAEEMEMNFQLHKQTVRRLLNSGVSPDIICKEFEDCGVRLDQERVSDSTRLTEPDFGFELFFGVVLPVAAMLVLFIFWSGHGDFLQP